MLDLPWSTACTQLDSRTHAGCGCSRPHRSALTLVPISFPRCLARTTYYSNRLWQSMFRRSIDTAVTPSDNATFYRLATEGNVEGVEVRHRTWCTCRSPYYVFVDRICLMRSCLLTQSRPLVAAGCFGRSIYAALRTPAHSNSAWQPLQCTNVGLPTRSAARCVSSYAFFLAGLCSACTVGCRASGISTFAPKWHYRRLFSHQNDRSAGIQRPQNRLDAPDGSCHQRPSFGCPNGTT